MNEENESPVGRSTNKIITADLNQPCSITSPHLSGDAEQDYKM